MAEPAGRGGTWGGGHSPAPCHHHPYLYVPAVMAPGWELNPPEGDGALEGHLDGRLLHAVLAVGPRSPRDGPAAEVALDWGGWGWGEGHRGSERGRRDGGGTVVASGHGAPLPPPCCSPPIPQDPAGWGCQPRRSLLVMQCSAGSRRFLMRPCSTERTEGRCTSCRTKRWDCGETGRG